MYVLVWLHGSQKNVRLIISGFMGCGIVAARAMCVPHFGQGVGVSSLIGLACWSLDDISAIFGCLIAQMAAIYPGVPRSMRGVGVHRAGLWDPRYGRNTSIIGHSRLFKSEHFQSRALLNYSLREQRVKKKPQLSGWGLPVLSGAQT